MKKIKPKNRAELRELVKDNDIYLGDIDTSAISDMRALFKDVKRKDFSGIESWDVSSARFIHIFDRSVSFNQCLDSWNPKSIEYAYEMFFIQL